MNNLASPNNFLNKASNSNKYSNYTLFSRRETEYSSKIQQKNSSTQRPFSSSVRKISTRNYKNSSNNKIYKSIIPNIFSENQSSVFSNNSSKTTIKNRIHVEDYFHKKNKSKTNQANVLESILNLEKYYTPNLSFNNKYMKTNPNLNININVYFNDLKYINQIYLTEANIQKSPKKKVDSTFNNFFEDYNGQTIKDFSKNHKVDILTKFQNDKSAYDYIEAVKNEYNERIIKIKDRRINLRREKKDEFMEKERNEKFDKLSLNSKKELYERIKEIYQNKIEYLDDRIGSFESWKNLNRDFFENKIGDYLKFLMYKKAYEKNKLEDLYEKIIEIKKESNKIYSKMAKIEIEKNKILRWVYFQIKLKEKKIKLPDYYKLILENINLIDNYYELKAKKEKSNLYSSSSPAKKSFKQKKNIKKSTIVFNTDKEKEKDEFYININNELLAFLNKKDGKKEYLRIKKYKNEPIYKTADEFNDGLLSIEKEDLRLIEYNDFIKEKIFWFKKELDKATKDKNKMYDIYKYNLQINLNELNQLKQRYSSMKTIIKNLKNNKINKNKNNKEKNSKRNKSASIFTKRNKNQITNKKILYTKINKLFNLCKLVKFKNKKDYEILYEKKKLFKNNEIIYYFVYIEYCVNYLMNEMHEFKNNHKDGERAIKKIFFDIEKGHRLEKAEEMRRQLREKFIKLEKDIDKRNNKIYFLPYRKVRDVMKIKKEKIVVKEQENQQLNFEDFISEDNDDDSNYQNFEEEKNL